MGGKQGRTSPVDAVDTSLRRKGKLFVTLWALAHLVHAWHQGSDGVEASLEDLGLIAVVVAVLVVLWRPSSTKAVASLALIQFVTFVAQMPLVANHWTIAAFANAGLIATCAARPSLLREHSGRLVSELTTFLKLIFLISYSAAAIAKLNSGFLDPVHSCATDLMQYLGIEPAAVPLLGVAAVAVTVGVELAVPVLLLMRRTRLLGIVLAGVFHLALAVTPAVTVMDFSLFVFALIALFAPPDVGDRLALQVEASPIAQRLRRTSPVLRALGGAGTAAFVLIFAIGRGPVVGGATWALVSWGVFVLVGAFVVTMGLAVLWSYRGTPAPQTPAGSHASAVPIHLVGLLALLVLNAASPYLGGKTTSSFTMFSNLRTEGMESNHVLIPRLPIETMQDDLVRISTSSNPVLQRHAEDGNLLAYHEVRRTLRTDPTASVDLERAGEQLSYEDASEDPELTSLSFASRKLFHFRPVNETGPPICQP